MDIKTGTARVKGFEMKYFSFGTGNKDLAVIPGLSIKPVSLSAAAVAAQYSIFAEDYRVWFFDRRSAPPADYTISDMAEDTAEVLSSLGIERPCLFGVSQGGMIAITMAIRYPDMVRSLIIGSSAAEVDMTESSALSEWINLAEKGEKEELYRTFMKYVYTPELFGEYENYAPVLAGDTSDGELNNFIILAKAVEGFSVMDSLDRIKCPMLVIGAEQDKVLGAEPSRKIAERTGCELYIYPGYGHAVYDEAPDYKERLKAFFDFTGAEK